ncbi:hypothetical protein [Anaerotignum sp. MB30-C6]|uniref:hypothetical protein n=1 Tax=Anaerotignum sp. MB30-C6 TaxID=3070814 RepID=UPI0027DBEDA0|nr:hypothetical protein [Anaerotignum sp. MB30-C6]WMI81451.1 hypothetical protein RBQ60_01585 [Anaerotignum sp. MB30-C6]
MNAERKEKVLVLVTAQKNSLRLIDYGFSLSLADDAELHILHVQKGNSVFEGKDSLKRLQELVDYGGRMGACIHVQCDLNVAQCVSRFVKKEGITRVVLGEAPQEKQEKVLGEWDRIIQVIPEEIKINVVAKEKAERERLIV